MKKYMVAMLVATLVLVKSVQANQMLNLTPLSRNFIQTAVYVGQCFNEVTFGLSQAFERARRRGSEAVGAKIAACFLKMRI